MAKSIIELNTAKKLRVAGLMSGTSADGVDVAIVDIDNRSKKLVGYATVPYPPSVRKAVFNLFQPQTSHVDDICHYNFVLGHLFAEALKSVCQKTSIPLASIDLIGSHGQTIYHNPVGRRYSAGRIRSTLQIGEPSVIAQQTGITTVADFRPRDIACGGQGAPLVPFADLILFRHPKLNRAIQNIGGIANVSFLPAGSGPDKIIAFDTGPGNMIMDGLMTLFCHKKYDHNGALAATGRVCQTMLNRLLKHPYLRKCPPKTCGREEFGLQFCRTLYDHAKASKISPADCVATATALTAHTIIRAYRRFLPVMPDEMILCGGGARNAALIKMLKTESDGIKIMTTNALGIDLDAKEALSFAILAWAAIKGVANNVPAATGATQSAILGKIIPAC